MRSTTVDELTERLLALPVEDRAVLAQRLWDSIEHFAEPATREAWLDEADRRWREIEEGTVQCVPATEVMRRARASLRER
jgi:putative addiction module component (TIGR02574 family)